MLKLKYKKTRPLKSGTSFTTRGTTLLARQQAALFEYNHTLASDNGGIPAQPTEFLKPFSLQLTSVFPDDAIVVSHQPPTL